MPCGGPCPRGDCGAEREGPRPPWELLRRGCPCPTEGMKWDPCPIEQGTGRRYCSTEGWKTDPVPQNKAQREGTPQRADGGETFSYRTRHRETSHCTEGLEEGPFHTEQGTWKSPTPQGGWKRVPSLQNKAQGEGPAHSGAARGTLPHRGVHREGSQAHSRDGEGSFPHRTRRREGSNPTWGSPEGVPAPPWALGGVPVLRPPRGLPPPALTRRRAVPPGLTPPAPPGPGRTRMEPPRPARSRARLPHQHRACAQRVMALMGRGESADGRGEGTGGDSGGGDTG